MKTAYDFDIDVDLSPILDGANDDALISAGWYDLIKVRSDRSPALKKKLDALFRQRLLKAQWMASRRRNLDRRTQMRVPLMTRVYKDDGGHMLLCDLSATGIRCCGEASAPVMDVEFKMPGLDFPISTKIEVMRYSESNVAPMVGSRFVEMESVYTEHIQHFIDQRRKFRVERRSLSERR